jgi:integrase
VTGLHVVNGATPITQSINLDQVLEDFERAMLRQRVLPATVRIYRWSLEDLFEVLKGAGVRDICELSKAMLHDWQGTMATRRWRPTTANLATNSVRRFISWANESGLVDLELAGALSKLKAPQTELRRIPPEDLARITAYLLPRRPRMSLVDLRDRALFFYLLTTGASISEALKDRRDRLLSEETAAGVLSMPPLASEFVHDYLRGRTDSSPWLWISHKSNGPAARLGAPGVWDIWLKLAKELGLRGWSTKQLQHTPCPPALLVPHPIQIVRSTSAESPREPQADVAIVEALRPERAPAWFVHVATIWMDTLVPRAGRRYHVGRGISWMARSLGRAYATNPLPLEQAVAIWDQDFYVNGSLLGLKTADSIHWMVPAIAEWGRSESSTSAPAQNRWDSALESWAVTESPAEVTEPIHTQGETR